MEWKLIISAVTWLRSNWTKVQPWITPVALAPGKKVPKDTFRIVLDTEFPAWWHMAGQGDEPVTQIRARYYATNITDEKMLILGCKLKPEGSDQAYDLRHHIEQMRDDGKRTPTTLLLVDGFIHPAITREGEVLHAKVIFVDQFGNEISGPLTTFPQR